MAANEAMEAIHDRMTVILAADDWPRWLGEEGEGTPADLVRPCPPDWLRLWPVDARVGNVRNNDPGLLADVGAGPLL